MHSHAHTFVIIYNKLHFYMNPHLTKAEGADFCVWYLLYVYVL